MLRTLVIPANVGNVFHNWRHDFAPRAFPENRLQSHHCNSSRLMSVLKMLRFWCVYIIMYMHNIYRVIRILGGCQIWPLRHTLSCCYCREHVSWPEGAHSVHHRVDPQHPAQEPHRGTAHQVWVWTPAQRADRAPDYHRQPGSANNTLTVMCTDSVQLSRSNCIYTMCTQHSSPTPTGWHSQWQNHWASHETAMSFNL